MLDTVFLVFLAITFFLNIPFGYWRAGERKFSWQWFIAIHFPVVVLAILRHTALKVERDWVTFPIFLLVFFFGQLAGKKWHQHKHPDTNKKSL